MHKVLRMLSRTAWLTGTGSIGPCLQHKKHTTIINDVQRTVTLCLASIPTSCLPYSTDTLLKLSVRAHTVYEAVQAVLELNVCVG